MTRADKRRFHYIYKITRLDESGKYYIGLHSTDDLDDGYFGSGSLLSRSIKKHGKDKHTKEILEFLPTREALKLREKEIVNEELLSDEQCMNLKLGGEGGWDHIKTTSEILRARARLGGLKSKGSKVFRSDSALMEWRQNISNGTKGRSASCGMLGKKHTSETRMRQSESHSGEKNSQFGTCWVHNVNGPIVIKKIDLEEYLSKGFFKGRKCQ